MLILSAGTSDTHTDKECNNLSSKTHGAVYSSKVISNMSAVRIIGRRLFAFAPRAGPTVALPKRTFQTGLLRRKEDISVTYVFPDGGRSVAKGKEGDNLLDLAINNDVEIDGFGACEGTLACSTCHLIFSQEVFDKLPDEATDVSPIKKFNGMARYIDCENRSETNVLILRNFRIPFHS